MLRFHTSAKMPSFALAPASPCTPLATHAQLQRWSVQARSLPRAPEAHLVHELDYCFLSNHRQHQLVHVFVVFPSLHIQVAQVHMQKPFIRRNIMCVNHTLGIAPTLSTLLSRTLTRLQTKAGSSSKRASTTSTAACTAGVPCCLFNTSRSASKQRSFEAPCHARRAAQICKASCL